MDELWQVAVFYGYAKISPYYKAKYGGTKWALIPFVTNGYGYIAKCFKD